MLEGRDANDLLAELRELQRKQVHPRDADTILSTVHKAKVNLTLFALVRVSSYREGGEAEIYRFLFFFMYFYSFYSSGYFVQ